MSQPFHSYYPFLLMPVKVETRFVRAGSTPQLWVRVFPDQVFLDEFDPRLTPAEQQDRKAFLQKPEAERLNAWKELVSRYGQHRAAWLVQAAEEELQEYGSRGEEEFPAYCYRFLPDEFDFYLRFENGEEKSYSGKQIPNNELPLFPDEPDDWLTDFDKAVDAGMAVRITLEEKLVGLKISRLLVVGRQYRTQEQAAQGVVELVRTHRYSEGMTILDYGTPTNNLKGSKSGYSSKEEYDALGSFPYAVERLKLEDAPSPGPLSYGKKLAQGLGLPPQTFAQVRGADGAPCRLTYLLQKATWFALGGKTLRMLLGDNLSHEDHEFLFEIYSEYVRARGNYPAVRIDDQPYSICPILPFTKDYLHQVLKGERGTREQKLIFVLTGLFDRWRAMLKRPESVEGQAEDLHYVPRMEDAPDPALELVRILSMEPVSSYHQIREQRLDRIQGPLPEELLHKVKTPGGLHHYAPALVDELLSPHWDEGKRDREMQEKKWEALHFFSPKEEKNRETMQEMLNRPHLLRHAPLLDLKDHRTHRLDASQLKVYIQKDDANKNSAELDALEQYLDQWLTLAEKAHDKQQGEVEKEPVLYLPGELSLITGLILEGLQGMVSLYNRDVYFEPTREEVEGYASYELKTAEGLLGKHFQQGEEICRLIGKPAEGGAQKTVSIKAPFSGRVVKTYLEKDGDPLPADGRVLRLRHPQKYLNKVKEAVALGKALIEEMRRLSPEDLPQRQAAALADILDLNSHRLDAWIAGLAEYRLEKGREKGAERGLYFGAFGWLEHLEQNETVVNDRDMMDKPSREGGIIHTPTIPQAVAAAMFKQSFLNHQYDQLQGNPFVLNLTSDRIQKSMMLQDGLRQGQELGALLGMRMERFLHEAGADRYIYDLRRVFPLTTGREKIHPQVDYLPGIPTLQLVDGGKVLETVRRLRENEPVYQEVLDRVREYREQLSFSGGNEQEILQNMLKEQVIQEGIRELEDVLDGSLDLLFFEAGYQMTQGNFSQAAAAMDATKGAVDPPQIESVQTRLPGAMLEHKLALLFEPPPQRSAAEEEALLRKNPRAYLEPTLEQWLEKQLGPLSRIGLQVLLFEKEAQTPFLQQEVSLAELDIGYLDFYALSLSPLQNAASELEQRVLHRLRQAHELPEGFRFELTENIPENWASVQEAKDLMDAIRELLRQAKPLETAHLAWVDEDTVTAPELLQPLQQRLQSCVELLRAPDTPLNTLAYFGVENAKGIYDPEAAGGLEYRTRQEALRRAAKAETCLQAAADQGMDYAGKWKQLKAAAGELFGKDMPLIPPFQPSPLCVKGIGSAQQKNLVGEDRAWEEEPWDDHFLSGQERIRQWLEGRAAVNGAASAFTDYLMFAEAWDPEEAGDWENPYLKNWRFRILQYLRPADRRAELPPLLDEQPWMALAKWEIDTLREKNKLEKVDWYYPGEAQAAAVFCPPGWQPQESRPAYGLLVDRFTEQVPEESAETGLAFEYDRPNNEAPQALLLVSAPPELEDDFWDKEYLKCAVSDALDLAKVRMVDLDALKRFGFLLPMTHIVHLPKPL